MDTERALEIIKNSPETDYNQYAAAVRKISQELKRYQAIGTVEEFKRLKENS